MFRMNGDVFYILIDRIWKDSVITICPMVILAGYPPVRNKSDFLRILYNLFGFKTVIPFVEIHLNKIDVILEWAMKSVSRSRHWMASHVM